jgi:hypothetical protein
MQYRLWRCLAIVPALVCFGTAAGAAGRPDRPDGKSTRAPGVARPVGPTSTLSGASFGVGIRATAILGAAWTADNLPIKQANLRLRNIVSGKIEATTVANDVGQFAFENVPGGSYVVELVNASGHVQVVGHMFTIAPGETVATFVRTGTKVPWVNGFFSNSVSSVSSTAASQGVTAIAPVARPISPAK